MIELILVLSLTSFSIWTGARLITEKMHDMHRINDEEFEEFSQLSYIFKLFIDGFRNF